MLILLVAAVQVYVGIFYVDYTMPIPNVLVLRWLVFNHFQRDTTESIDSTLVCQKSTLELPVTTVKVYVGIFYVDYTTPFLNALLLRWLVCDARIAKVLHPPHRNVETAEYGLLIMYPHESLMVKPPRWPLSTPGCGWSRLRQRPV